MLCVDGACYLSWIQTRKLSPRDVIWQVKGEKQDWGLLNREPLQLWDPKGSSSMGERAQCPGGCGTRSGQQSPGWWHVPGTKLQNVWVHSVHGRKERNLLKLFLPSSPPKPLSIVWPWHLLYWISITSQIRYKVHCDHLKDAFPFKTSTPLNRLSSSLEKHFLLLLVWWKLTYPAGINSEVTCSAPGSLPPPDRERGGLLCALSQP